MEKQTDLREELAQALEAALDDKTMNALNEKIRSAVVDVVEEVEYGVKENLVVNLSSWVQRMAEEAVENLLAGDEDEMRARLSCRENSYTGRDKQHPVIHGQLFETGALALRKKIVNAFPELLKTERILDLEDQITSLVKQNNRLEQRNQELFNRL